MTEDQGVDQMTEEEHIEMVKIGNKFWHEFSALCNSYILKAPPHLIDIYTMYLGEKTSIYGRNESTIL